MALSKQEQEDLRQRINELAKKKREIGLTEVEEAERHELHQQFLANFRAGFKQTVENIQIFDKNGKEVTSEKAKAAQRKKGLRKD